MMIVCCGYFLPQARCFVSQLKINTRAFSSIAPATHQGILFAKKKVVAKSEVVASGEEEEEEAIKKKNKAEAVRNHFSRKEQDTFNRTSTDTEFAFVVYGEPIVLARHRSTSIGFMYNPSAKHQSSFLKACEPFLPTAPFEGPLEAKLVFYMPRPKLHYKGSKNPILRDSSPRWHDTRKGKRRSFPVFVRINK